MNFNYSSELNELQMGSWGQENNFEKKIQHFFFFPLIRKIALERFINLIVDNEIQWKFFLHHIHFKKILV